MNTHHDRMLAAPYAEDEGFGPDTEVAIEEVSHVPDCYDNWLSNRPLPLSVAELLALFYSSHLPFRDKTPDDDALLIKFEELLDAGKKSFAKWAQENPVFMSNITHRYHALPSPVGAWISAKGAV